MPRSDAIDVSEHQGWVNWLAVRGADLQLAAVRAVDGHGRADDRFAANWSQMRLVGIPYRIAYHFVSAQQPLLQAQRFADIVGPLGPHEGVQLDVEPDSGAGIGYLDTGHIRAVCEAFKTVVGREPLLYMGAFYRAPGMNVPAITSADLQPCHWWLPWYRSTAPTLTGTKHARPVVWQWSGSGSYPGVSGPCDLNEVWDWATVRALCNPPPVPSAPLPKAKATPPVEEEDMAARVLVRHGTTTGWHNWVVTAGGKYWLPTNEAVQLVAKQLGYQPLTVDDEFMRANGPVIGPNPTNNAYGLYSGS